MAFISNAQKLRNPQQTMELNSRERTYAVTAYIPKAHVLTYKLLSQLAQVTNPRQVGSYLHKNPYPGVIPCHRVINSQGRTARTFAFGGDDVQLQLLKNEGVAVTNKRVDLTRYIWRPSQVFKEYLTLLYHYGPPGSWPWFGNKPCHTKEEVIISAILTQHTNWRNVEKVIDSLRKEGCSNLHNMLRLHRKNPRKLQELIKPAGFYNQKTERLVCISALLTEKYSGLSSFFRQPLTAARNELLSIKGIGNETADTILLFAGNKPSFIVDTYTKRFVVAKGLQLSENYEELQKYFESHLPRKVDLYQDYHALIVTWGMDNR